MKTNHLIHLFTSGTSPPIWFVPSVKNSDNLHVKLSIRRSFLWMPPQTSRYRDSTIKALGLPLSEKKNSEISLSCSYDRTCQPHGRTSPNPRGIVWTNLVEVPKEMLLTKYQGSRPSNFRVEELWNFHSLFLCSTCDPRAGLVLTPGALYEQTS